MRRFAFAIGAVVMVGAMAVVIDLIKAPNATPDRMTTAAGGGMPPGQDPASTDNLDARASLPASSQNPLTIQLDMMLRANQVQDAATHDRGWAADLMTDARLAGRPISADAVVLAIEACKTLVYQVWRRASLHAAGPHSLQPGDIDAVVQGVTGPGGERFDAVAAGTTADHDDDPRPDERGCLISLAMEAVLGTGLFAGRQIDILPVSPTACDRLAAGAAFITRPFLSRCGQIAKQAGHVQVQAEDVRAAFALVIAHDELSDATPTGLPYPSPPSPPSLSQADGGADLLHVTRELIRGARSSYGASQVGLRLSDLDQVEQQRSYLNRFVTIPCDAAGFAQVRQRVRQLADSVALGVAPLSRVMFTSAAIAHPRPLDDPASAGVARRAFADLPWTVDLLDDLVPRPQRAEGGMSALLVPVPGMPLSRTGAGAAVLTLRAIRFQDAELAGVRDCGIAWTLMQEAWQAPQARPADPIALEALADRMSELVLILMRAANGQAADEGARVIDRRICDLVLNGYQLADFPLPAVGPPAAPTTRAAFTPAAVRGIFPAPFLDAATGSGFPATIQVPRPDGTALQTGAVAALVDVMGAGIAVGDIDDDGLPDLFLAGDGGNRLLHNLGNGRFQDVTTAYGVLDPRLDDAHQALFVDYDNDGRLDLFIVHAHSPSRLFHQMPDGHFEDVTGTCGIITGDTAHDAVWFDYDNDGLLDCYVGHYGSSHPTLDGRNGGRNRLFHNLGNGHFADVTDRSHLGSTGWTLALAACDFTHDGMQDLFVANDYGRSELYHNNGDGTFTEEGHAAGVDLRGSSRGACLIDPDGDGWMGIAVTQNEMFATRRQVTFPSTAGHRTVNQRILGATLSVTGSPLLRNRHDGTFTTFDSGLLAPHDQGWCWSATFFDYANAGQDDCYLTNGWLAGTPAGGQQHALFILHEGRYVPWDRGGAQSYRSNARACVAADLLGDGRMDLVVNEYGAPPHLLLSTCRSDNHWIKVRLHGVHANRQGIGSLVQVVAGRLGQWKAVTCGSNYLSQEDTTLTFGVGLADHIDAINVVWPGNHLQHLAGPIPVDRLSVLTEAPGQSAGP